MDRLLRVSDVLKSTGLKRSFLYSEIKRGRFPAPIKVSPRVAVWRESELNAWRNCAIAQPDDSTLRQQVREIILTRTVA
jgi:prophage regulatory protein